MGSAGRAVIATTLVVGGAFMAVTPATAAVIPDSHGNAQPVTSGRRNSTAACDPGEHWVYVSSHAKPRYNPLGKTTDDLGASEPAPPKDVADQYRDGITVALSADGASAFYSVDAGVAPTITIEKVVVKAGNGFTVFTGADAVPNTPLSSPPGDATRRVNRAYVCYSVLAQPLVPEAPMAILLPLAGLACGAVVLLVRRRRRA